MIHDMNMRKLKFWFQSFEPYMHRIHNEVNEISAGGTFAKTQVLAKKKDDRHCFYISVKVSLIKDGFLPLS